jgi:hypothetical protein
MRRAVMWRERERREKYIDDKFKCVYQFTDLSFVLNLFYFFFFFVITNVSFFSLTIIVIEHVRNLTKEEEDTLLVAVY